MKGRRLFLALPIPELLGEELRKIRRQIDLPLKWIPTDNLHITVLFLGTVEEDHINELSQKIALATEGIPAFQLVADKIKVQRNRFQSMIWLTFERSEAFSEMVKTIAKEIHFSIDKKPLPHVNLVRSKSPIHAPLLPEKIKGDISLSIQKVELWESHLSPNGATYTSLNGFYLRR